MEVVVPLLDPPWSWAGTLVPMAIDSTRLNGRRSTRWPDHSPFVIFERSDEAGGGDTFFVFFSVRGGRRPGVAGAENVICCFAKRG